MDSRSWEAILSLPQASFTMASQSAFNNQDSSNLKLFSLLCLWWLKDCTYNNSGRWFDAWADKCVTLLNGNFLSQASLATPLSNLIFVFASPSLLLFHVNGYPLNPRFWSWQDSKASLNASTCEVYGGRLLFFSEACKKALKSLIIIQGPSTKVFKCSNNLQDLSFCCASGHP